MKDTTFSVLFGMAMGALAALAVFVCFVDIVSKNTNKVCNAYDAELQRLGYLMPAEKPEPCWIGKVLVRNTQYKVFAPKGATAELPSNK